MPVELEGSAGRMVIDAGGQIAFVRGGRVVLQSAEVPAFVLLYGVEFATEGPPDMDPGARALTARYRTSDARFTLTLDAEATDRGFRLRWSTPATSGMVAVGTAWNLDPQGPWYGQGERVIQTWPLDRLPVVSDPLIPYDYARDGTLNIVTPLWFNAGGAAILALDESGELATTLTPGDHAGGEGLLRIWARQPERTVGLELGAQPNQSRTALALDVMLADDIQGAYSLAVETLGHPTSWPPQEMIARPIWTTWAHYKMAVTQADVLQFAEAIVEHDYPRSVLEIDDRWQAMYGETDWDYAKFPDPHAMVDRLHDMGFRVTLWVPPFFEPSSSAYTEAAERGYLMRHPAGGGPSLVRWWQGYGGIIDVTNRDALSWWRARLGRLQSEFGVDGFKFDAGEGNFVPRDRVTSKPLLSREYADLYVAWVAENFEWTEVRAGWRSQRHGLLFREWDKGSHWRLDNGLHSVLTQALALGMTGYPFILPDMIGGDAYGGESPDAELMVRWTELTALLPAMQFSVPPWTLGDDTNAICRRYALLHEEIAPYIRTLMEESISSGAPLVRPLFWHAPGDQTALNIDDEFLLGERFLVAPVVLPGQTTRDVYLPAGRWRDWWSDKVIGGPGYLKEYPAPLETLPLFERV